MLRCGRTGEALAFPPMSGRCVLPAVSCIGRRRSCRARLGAIVFPKWRAGSRAASASRSHFAIHKVTAINDGKAGKCRARHNGECEKERKGNTLSGGRGNAGCYKTEPVTDRFEESAHDGHPSGGRFPGATGVPPKDAVLYSCME